MAHDRTMTIAEHTVSTAVRANVLSTDMPYAAVESSRALVGTAAVVSTWVWEHYH